MFFFLLQVSKWNTVVQGWAKCLIVGPLWLLKFDRGAGATDGWSVLLNLLTEKKYVKNLFFNVENDQKLQNQSPQGLEMALKTLKRMMKCNYFMTT